MREERDKGRGGSMGMGHADPRSAGSRCATKSCREGQSIGGGRWNVMWRRKHECGTRLSTNEVVRGYASRTTLRELRRLNRYLPSQGNLLHIDVFSQVYVLFTSELYQYLLVFSHHTVLSGWVSSQ
jgi:hypothetical protein